MLYAVEVWRMYISYLYLLRLSSCEKTVSIGLCTKYLANVTALVWNI